MAAQASAPIALFIYNRPAHVRRTVASLLANPEAAESDLFVFCDGAKTPESAAAVEEARAFVRGLTGFASLTVVERERNLGLAKSIIDGVTRLCRDRGRVIVLEDDLVLSPYFLRYMNDALDCYADAPLVASIHGYLGPVHESLPETFFLRGADCWGWATWSRAWQVFEPDAAKLLARLRHEGLTQTFDMEGAEAYTKMLEDFIAGKNDSWAVRWHASAFLRGMFTLYPGRSLVENIGFDGSGMHSGSINPYRTNLAQEPIVVRQAGTGREHSCAQCGQALFEFSAVGSRRAHHATTEGTGDPELGGTAGISGQNRRGCLVATTFQLAHSRVGR